MNSKDVSLRRGLLAKSSATKWTTVVFKLQVYSFIVSCGVPGILEVFVADGTF